MACSSTLCTVIILKVFIKSTQLRCLRNPACSFLRICSTASCILFKMTLVRIFLGVLKRVIPLQLLKFARSPFFGILITNPSSHSSTIFSYFHIFSSRGYSISTVISGSTLSISGFILSRPTAFPFFSRRVQVYFSLIFIFIFIIIIIIIIIIIFFYISHFLLTSCFIIIFVEYFGKMFFPSLQLFFLCC